MKSQYSVVQFVPFPSSDERINLGVIAFDEDHDEGDTSIAAKFIAQWTRVSAFGPQASARAKQFVDEFDTILLEARNRCESQGEILEYLHRSHSKLIQFSEPRPSMTDAHETLERMWPIMVPGVVEKRKHHQAATRTRNKRQVSAQSRNSLGAALERRYGPVEGRKLISSKPEVAGTYEPHLLDFGIENGTILLGASALSFQTKDQERDVDVAKWAFSDIRDAEPTLPLAAIVLPPADDDPVSQEHYAKACDIFVRLHIDMVEVDNVDQWAISAVSDLNYDVAR